jgi:UDP-N-acetylglucosamine 2-epimerase (non-hydrolysing)
VANALDSRGLHPRIVFTGQQSLDPGDFGLAGYRACNLGCPGQENPHRHVRSVTEALLRLLEQPDLLIVQGDTSSALGGALAGFAAGVSVAHVEAGLRTHDPSLPWPEEEYRTAIDAQADLLFAPTELSARNLRDEQASGEIHVTGNSGIDALLMAEASLPTRLDREGDKLRLLVTCHRRESWGEGLKSISAAVTELARDGRVQIHFILHPNQHVAAAMTELLGDVPNIELLQPFGHSELVRRVRDSDLVLSDSGGIQEEAPALGVPLLVLRDKTERPEGIATGNARLVGTETARIVGEARRLLNDPLALAAMSHRAFPYGDGRAAPRIAAIIEVWLDRRRGEQRRLA